MTMIFCGMPGSGKTYLGAKIAKELNWPFIDTDELVISQYFSSSHQQLTCREIRLKEGNAFFRHLENLVIKRLQPTQPSIIAVGGGSLCSPQNVPILKKLGWLIYLKLPPQLLFTRLINKRPLPSYLDERNIENSFNALLKERLPLYEQYCDFCINDLTIL